MEMTFFLPLFLTTSSLIVFWLIYQLFLAKLTHFTWQRGYLISSILFSFCLPFIPRFTNWWPSISANDSLTSAILVNPLTLDLTTETSTKLETIESMSPTIDFMAIFGGLLAILYLTGIILKTLFFIDKLSVLHQLISTNPKEKEGKQWFVKLPESGTAFSFFNYIFFTKSIDSLNPSEVAQIKAHEQIHCQQKHSFDILLIEVAEIFLWFLPVIYWMKNSLKDLHEYLVDEAMIQEKVTKKGYAQLLMKLSSPLSINSLTTGFTNKQIGRRINMLAKKPSAAYHKLKFLLMLPIIASLLLFSACFGEALPINVKEQKGEGIKIGKITWEGNTIFSDAQLSERLNIKSGDEFNEEMLFQQLNWNGKGTDVSSLYFDNGFAYFDVQYDNITRIPDEGTIDLIFRIFEGVDVSIASITFSGNKSIPASELEMKIDIKPGELFNRSKIIAAQKALLETGKFDPEKISISTPILAENNQLMNLEFSLVEIEK